MSCRRQARAQVVGERGLVGNCCFRRIIPWRIVSEGRVWGWDTGRGTVVVYAHRVVDGVVGEEGLDGFEGLGDERIGGREGDVGDGDGGGWVNEGLVGEDEAGVGGSAGPAIEGDVVAAHFDVRV